MSFPSAADFQFTDEHRFLCGLGGLEFERVTQIWLYFPLVSGSGGQSSLRPPIFNSQMTQIFSGSLCGGGIKRVPQISQMNTDFFDLFGLDDADFSFISYTQMRPIRSDLRRFFANLCGSPCRGICLGGCEGGV